MERGADNRLSRQQSIVAERTALLIIDAQNWTLDSADKPPRRVFDDAAAAAVANVQRLLIAARTAGLEVVFTVVENLTADGRDRSLDYKLSGFFVAKGSRDAEVVAALAPGPDEMVIPKTSSSLFNSTNFDYLMRNIGIDTIAATGFLTDQCVDHTIRDGADRGYRMICVSDACATETETRHRAALAGFKGYCRTETTDRLIGLLNQ